MAIDLSTIPWLAVLLAVVVNFVLGFAWYHPKTPTGRTWLRGLKMDPDNMPKPPPGMLVKSLLIQAIGAVLIMSTLAYVFVAMTGAYPGSMTQMPALDGAIGGFFVWLGFFLPVQLGSLAWEGKPGGFVAVNAGYWLVSLAAAGAIIGSMS